MAEGSVWGNIQERTKKETLKRLRTKLDSTPKSALSILNELGVKPEFYESDRPTGIGTVKTFIANTAIDGCEFTGEGNSKQNAKQAAAKKAAKYLLNEHRQLHVKSPKTPTFLTSGLTKDLRTDSGSTKLDRLRTEFKNGKAPAMCLKEYAELSGHAEQPVYQEVPSPNATLYPFGGVYIYRGIKYTVGMGRSKKDAKQDAAKKTLNKLFSTVTDSPATPDPPPPSPPRQPEPIPPRQPESRPPRPPRPGPPDEPKPNPGNVYPMTSMPRGYALIINNQLFPGDRKKYRHGSQKDVEMLSELFVSLDFEVIVMLDLTGQRMLDELHTFSQREEHKDRDCVVVAIMSHGKNGSVLGVDEQEVPVDRIIGHFHATNAENLMYKPKFFIFQCCRGTKQDRLTTDSSGASFSPDSYLNATLSSTLEMDHSSMTRLIPTEADILVAYATTPGYFSYRDQVEGSLFIQKLFHQFKKDIKEISVGNVLDLVQGDLAAHEGELNEETLVDGRKVIKQVKVKQMASHVSHLTKIWKLT